jgi:thiol-disulfide isomerase/thioredoxin
MIPRHFWVSFSIAVLIVLIYQFFPHASKTEKSDFSPTLLEIGYVPSNDHKSLADLTFEFYTNDGTGRFKKEEKKIADFAGKPVILHFWATWCGPCVQELPTYDHFAGQFSQIVHIAAVSDQTMPNAIQSFFQSKGIRNLPIVKDVLGAAGRLRIMGIPTTVFIDKKGCELGTIVGPIHWKDPKVVNLILTLLS